jgi:hypothetical protein
MAQRPSLCQSRVARIIVTSFLALMPALPESVSSQERDKAVAEATTLAREAVAARLSLPLERIRTVSVSPAQWRDSSLGCPERGMIYTPALASGHIVRLSAAEREHVVHVSGGRAVICSSQSDPKQSPTTTFSASLKAADAVRRAVAGRLGIERAAVRIVSTRPFRSSPPCPAAPDARKGAALLVEAEAMAQTFVYYADDALVVGCDSKDEAQRRGNTEK